jgi:ribosomal protein S19
MSTMRSQHVLPCSDGRWSVRALGASRVSRTFDSQDDAVAYASKRAAKDGLEVFIHNADGTVRQRAIFAPGFANESVANDAYNVHVRIDSPNTPAKDMQDLFVRTLARRSNVTPELIGHTIALNTGKKFVPVRITKDMVGHPLSKVRRSRSRKGVEIG